DAASSRSVPDAAVRRAAPLGRDVRAVARSRPLRCRAAASLESARPRALVLRRVGRAVLVVRLARRATQALVDGARRLRLRGVRPLRAARARARARPAAAL